MSNNTRLDNAVEELTNALICCPSITPEDAGCQNLLIGRLKKIGFEIERISANGVENLWAKRGHSEPIMCFAGHTDVVPPGNLSDWQTQPFEPEVINGFLYGRGAADMKGSLAAMVVAAERFIEKHPDHLGSIAFLITSDEEGAAVDGTALVVEKLRARNEIPTWCLVGEPTCHKQIGDTVKNGRRGSLNGYLTLTGKQGHVAYPHLATNPIHTALPILTSLSQKTWDMGNEHFPPTSFQMTTVASGQGTTNVIPGELKLIFNFRFSTETTAELLIKTVESHLSQLTLPWKMAWTISGQPFLTSQGALLDAIKTAIAEVTGITTKLSTDGGTSDGRFIATLGTEVIELGPINATIHQSNECVNLDDLKQLTKIYETLLTRLLL